MNARTPSDSCLQMISVTLQKGGVLTIISDDTTVLSGTYHQENLTSLGALEIG